MKTALSIAALFVAVGVAAAAHADHRYQPAPPPHAHGGWKHGHGHGYGRPGFAHEAMLHRRLLAGADGYQAGTLQWVGGHRLALRPFEHHAGVARVVFSPGTPVYFGHAMTTLEHLAPGTELTIYFRREAWGRTRVVAAVVLDELAAARMRREANAPVYVAPQRPVYSAYPTATPVAPAVNQPVVVGAPPPAHPGRW